MTNIPYIPVAPAISEKQLRAGLAGQYRFDPDKFRQCVLSCPGVDVQIAELVIEAVTKFASHPDGSIDVMKSGYVLGSILRETDENPEIAKIAKLVNDLDRLPFYTVENKPCSDDDAEGRPSPRSGTPSD
jgi:hypothetical protein